MDRKTEGFENLENIEIKKSIPADTKWQRLFDGWFNNHMMILLMAIQMPGKMAAEMRGNVGFFLDDLEHHYVDSRAGKNVWDAFRWFRAYLRVYPDFTRDYSRRALEMMGRIYGAMGRESRFLRHSVPEIKRAEDFSGGFAQESGVIVRLRTLGEAPEGGCDEQEKPEE
ncbi:MAG TPA: hypothetical protein PKL97_07065 [Candidatus Omnitrophota bacterium]|nr:hypothetical protein [Candidatus Omnitrophota bacterium]